ncbi:MAG: NAD(P)/FAD-dependent oxidoreductase [Tepidisphaeraceae bacterium]
MEHPFIVIGGGPAGSVAAIVLARAALPVILIEQSRFPRDKVCGECVSALGVEVLGELDLLTAIRACGATRLTRATFFAQSGQSLCVELPREMLGISRFALDALLLDQAAQSGARVIQPARVERIEPGAPPGVRFRNLLTNQVETISAGLVLLADGKSALLSKKPPLTAEMGIKAHFTGVGGAQNSIDMFSLDGEYGGIAPVEDGRWNVAMSVKSDRVQRYRGDISHMVAELSRSNPEFELRFQGASRVGDWLAAPLPRFGLTDDWPTGVVPIGNAACAIEPVGGEGIGLAMRSAAIATGEIIASRRSGKPLRVASIQSAYRKLWSARRASCRAVGLAASQPRLADFALWALGDGEQLSHAAMRLMGKS